MPTEVGIFDDMDSGDRRRWLPDMQLIPAVLAGGGRKMSQLSSSDRCWVVAGLTLSGLTAEEIADRLDCSLRLVRSIRAEDMTAVCTYVQTESRNFTDELRLAQMQLRQTAMALQSTEAELFRTKGKLDRMVDAHIVGARCCPKCSTPMTGYNVYVWGGKNYCRECHRQRSRLSRERAREYAGLPFAVARGKSVTTQVVTICGE